MGPTSHILDGGRDQMNPSTDGLLERLMSPFNTKIGYIGDKVLGGDLVPSG